MLQLDVQAEGLDFLDQDVEGLGRAGLQRVVALDERLVDLGAALHVVGLDGEQFLQRVRRAVGLERPHFHFAEALAAVLGLAAQRLLGDERVRADRAGVDLVRHEMVQLHHVDVADHDLLVDFLAGAAVEERALARGRQLGLLQVFADLLLGDAVEHRGRDLDAELFAGPAEMGLEHLADVHARRHAEGVQADFDRGAVRAGTACPPRARSWRRRPCCRGGRPSCRRPRASAWWRCRP